MIMVVSHSLIECFLLLKNGLKTCSNGVAHWWQWPDSVPGSFYQDSLSTHSEVTLAVKFHIS